MSPPASTAKSTASLDAQTIRLLIADDHVTVLEGLAAIIGRQADMVVVAKASNGRDAVELWKEHRPDVSLVDLRMPVLDGTDAITRICEIEPTARVIVLTTYSSDADLSNAISAGARGYLMKSSPREELLTAIRKVYAGEICIPALLLRRLTMNIHQDALTQRELEVLKLLARGLNNKEIGRDLFISETTVKTHLRSIFAKLKVRTRTGAIVKAQRQGFLQL